MNQQLKAVLLTIATLSLFVIALVELSGVSKTALINKFGSNENTATEMPRKEEVSREKQAASMPKTEIEFRDSLYQFGTIKEGEIVKHDFKFRNMGQSPLLIASAVASCGCTIPTFSKEPVLPGQEGAITVQFNSHGREGHQRKNVIVVSNAQQDKLSIGFEAEVVK